MTDEKQAPTTPDALYDETYRRERRNRIDAYAGSDPILDAYGRYDADPRVHGPDGYEAFLDAVLPLLEPQRNSRPSIPVKNPPPPSPFNGKRPTLKADVTLPYVDPDSVPIEVYDAMVIAANAIAGHMDGETTVTMTVYPVEAEPQSSASEDIKKYLLRTTTISHADAERHARAIASICFGVEAAG